MCQLFAVLSRFAKPSDEDGIEIYFTMKHDVVKKSKKMTKLVDIVRKHKGNLNGSSNIKLCLDRILKPYEQNLIAQKEYRAAHAVSASSDDQKPLTVYILTNGLWNGRADPTDSIRDMVSVLEQCHCRSSQVGIQFIGFGNDEAALARLDHYDDDLGLSMFVFRNFLMQRS